MKTLITFLMLMSATITFCQDIPFPARCEGEWEGTMVIYRNGGPIDTIPCTMSIVETAKDSVWTWKTTYNGQPPVVKDYRMIHPDKSSNYFVLDEGDGLELRSYQSGNSMFSNFWVQGSLLTSRYQLYDETLIFEITSGAIRDTTANNIVNYSVPIVQYSELRRSN